MEQNLVDNCEIIPPLTWNDEAGRRALRHSAAHIMAQAVQELFPEAKFAIGPAIEDGFYYDFAVDNPLL